MHSSTPQILLNQSREIGNLDGRRLERQLREKLNDWQGLLTRQMAQTRQILRKLLIGRLCFHPKRQGNQRYYEFTGHGALEGLLGGMLYTNEMVSPTGFEPVLPA